MLAAAHTRTRNSYCMGAAVAKSIVGSHIGPIPCLLPRLGHQDVQTIATLHHSKTQHVQPHMHVGRRFRSHCPAAPPGGAAHKKIESEQASATNRKSTHGKQLLSSGLQAARVLQWQSQSAGLQPSWAHTQPPPTPLPPLQPACCAPHPPTGPPQPSAAAPVAAALK